MTALLMLLLASTAMAEELPLKQYKPIPVPQAESLGAFYLPWTSEKTLYASLRPILKIFGEWGGQGLLWAAVPNSCLYQVCGTTCSGSCLISTPEGTTSAATCLAKVQTSTCCEEDECSACITWINHCECTP